MFEFAPRQAARIAFGAVLGVGAVSLFAHVLADPQAHDAARWIGWMWLVALVAAVIARVAMSFGRPEQPSERLLVVSFVVPAIGGALALPITLHLAWFAAGTGRIVDFDEWVRLSVFFTGLSHILFAVLAATRAGQLARGKPAASIWVIYGICVGAASIPLPVIPSYYVALTGLPILPLLYLMAPLAARERRALEVAPRAIARSA